MTMRILGLAAACVLSCSALSGENLTKPGVTPVQAELMGDLHARLVKTGGPVYARVTAEWHSPECILNTGATLEGHVVDVVAHVKGAKGAMPKQSQVSIAFTKAQCGSPKMTPFSLLLSAMAAPPHENDMGLISESLPSLITGGSNGAMGAGLMASMHTSAYLNYDFQTEIYNFPISPKMPIGYVSGIRGLKLSVGTGEENSSVLTAKDHDVSLEKHTLMLLIPTEGTIPRLTVDPAGVQHLSLDTSSVEAVPAPPPVEDIDLCAPPQCSQALPAGDSIDSGSASATMSMQPFGYATRPQREQAAFDHDDALAYLGPRELLVTFNPHKLVTRHALGRSGTTVRIVRAALMNTETHQVTHTVDWELPDDRQYLWPLTEGHVLVHVGSELRVYGADLKIQNRLPLDGPLAFVRVTPNGNFVAVGIVRERHSPELHAQMSQNLGKDPEEDVSILVLNRSFEVIAKSQARSGLMAPTLLNEGQASLKALPNNRYRIAMQGWDGQFHLVTQFSSTCTPELSSIAPDLLFLVSCAKQTDGREYRVLRPDGKLVLKGDSTLSELGHAAEGVAGSNAFVVKTVQSTLPAPPGVVFRADELSSEELRVYRATDGKRVFGVRVSSPTSSRDGYALAPDGSQLAVLNRDQIAVYPVSVK